MCPIMWPKKKAWCRDFFQSGCHPQRFRCLSHLDPYLHNNWLVANSHGVSHLDWRSAGFSLPGQWFQHSTGVSFQITSTLFCTKDFQSFSMPLIQKSVTCTCRQHLGSIIGGTPLIWSTSSIHLASISPSNRWSQPRLFLHSLWILKHRVTGDRNPRGSKIRPIRLITTLLVGFTVAVASNMSSRLNTSWSSDTFQRTPST